MKTGPEMPGDLDKIARAKWQELVESCDPDVDTETLANYCRQHSSLLTIRGEKAKQMKARTFETMVPGRDGTMQLNPLLTAESRLIASLNRMLSTLGLMPSRDERGTGRKPQSNPPPPGMSEPEPSWGWETERALCGDPKIYE
jgi:phage terminase small subunit